MNPYNISKIAKLTEKIKEHFPEVEVHLLSKEERNRLALELSNRNRSEKRQRQKQYLAF